MATNYFRIPLTTVPQRFAIDLAGNQYLITCKWNGSTGWMLDIADGITQDSIIACLPLVTGTDLLAQYGHLQLGFSMYVYTDGDSSAVPTLENLGVGSNVFIGVTV